MEKITLILLMLIGNNLHCVTRKNQNRVIFANRVSSLTFNAGAIAAKSIPEEKIREVIANFNFPAGKLLENQKDFLEYILFFKEHNFNLKSMLTAAKNNLTSPHINDLLKFPNLDELNKLFPQSQDK